MSRPKPPIHQPAPHYLAHPNFGVALTLGGLVGIAIPIMDHKYTLLGFLICWGSALAICVLYFSEWRFGLRKFKKPEAYVKAADKRQTSKDALIAPILALIYFASPILIYLDTTPPPESEIVTDWGPTPGVPKTFRRGQMDSFVGSPTSHMIVDGALVQKLLGKNDYKLIGVCFHHSHSVDIQDEPNISKSGPYDIENFPIQITIPWNEVFLREMIMDGMTGTGYELLALPNDQASSKFSTIREAVALGAKRLTRRRGPP
jgi:hypothetical protein